VVITDPNRYRGGTLAVEKFGADIIILDDAFQHRGVGRDADILLLDCKRPFANFRALPAGPLREPPRNIRRAQIIILTRSSETCSREAETAVRRFNPEARIFHANHTPTILRRHADDKTESLNMLKGMRVAAFAGIARPVDFEETMRGLGAETVVFTAFPDHHPYSASVIASLAEQAKEKDAGLLITTAKDSARLPAALATAVPLWILEIEFTVVSGNDKLIESTLALIQKRQRN
jgi:tetraacyldisaccharide 4'-kinase